jgi:hypothetical protein
VSHGVTAERPSRDSRGSRGSRGCGRPPPGPRFPRLAGPPEWDCFLSVKSVDRIEVTRQPQQATAAAIALARLER